MLHESNRTELDQENRSRPFRADRARHNADESSFHAMTLMHFAPEHFLVNDPNGSRLMTHARLLLKLSRRFQAVAPAALAHGARVANFKNGALIILAENGAIAVKLRQMSQRLCREMTTGSIVCESMEVRVQPRQDEDTPEGGHVKPLSRRATQEISRTRDGLPAGPLREALDTLLKRALTRE